MERFSDIGFILLPLIAYLLGSIPWGLVLTRVAAKDVDIRQHGSGNIGATNVRRVAGNLLGMLTLTGDVLKGAVPVLAASIWGPTQGVWNDLYVPLVALAAFAGHLYPVYLGFRDGGKGVATAAGCFCVISPPSVVVAVLAFVVVAGWSNRVSAGSLFASAVLPVAVWEVTGSDWLTGCAVLIAGLIALRHLENIKRLMDGTEPRICDRQSKSNSAS